MYYGFYRCYKNPWLSIGDICQNEKRVGLQKWRLSITVPMAPSHFYWVLMTTGKKRYRLYFKSSNPTKYHAKVSLNCSLRIFALEKNQASLKLREIFCLKIFEIASPSSINNFIGLILVSAHSFNKYVWLMEWVSYSFPELLELEERSMMTPMLIEDSQTESENNKILLAFEKFHFLSLF